MKHLHLSKHTLTHQAKRTGIVLAVVGAFSALGIGTAQAQEFSTAALTINSVGFLECAFKETGLGAGAAVNYTCGATDVGWLSQCFVKGKPVSNIAPRLHVAHNQTTAQTLFAIRRRTLTGSILTAFPTEEEEFQEPLCPESEAVVITEEITAIRWCNASLADTTNNILGASVSELFLQMKRNGASNVPDCATLATLPTDI
jgi:hypothetical protein